MYVYMNWAPYVVQANLRLNYHLTSLGLTFNKMQSLRQYMPIDILTKHNEAHLNKSFIVENCWTHGEH